MKALCMSGFGFMLTCNAMAAQTLDGNYKMDLLIGQKTFHDLMELRGRDQKIDVLKFHGKIIGKIIVPGNFEAELEGFGECSYEKLNCKFNFEITARETEEYKVIYEANLSGLDYKNFVRGATPVVRLTGSASTADGNVFGTFKAERE